MRLKKPTNQGGAGMCPALTPPPQKQLVPGPKEIFCFHTGAFVEIQNLYKNTFLPLSKKVRAGVANLTIDYSSLIAIHKFSPLGKLTADEIEDFSYVYGNLLKTIKLP